MLQAGLIGGAGVAALPLLALVGGITRTGEQPTGLAFSMNTNWLFGGQYTSGSESSFFDDSNFAPVTLPHTVTSLSWQNWDYPAWQQVWIYRRHFNGGRLLDPHRPGNRILVDFDGVMVNASVAINDQVVSTHQGGYLPFSAELTGKVTSGDNLLAVVVDSRCLPVPPVGVGRGPDSVDFFQPGGIYRDVRLRVLPQVFLSDLFAQPGDVLSSQPRVDIECAVDSAATTHAAGTLLVQLFDGQTQIAAQVTTVKVSSPGISTARLSLTGFGPVSLWSPDSPKLYTVQATLNFPGIGSHVLSRRIGFREASFRPEGFFLNGKRLQLFGLNRHQLYPYAGMAMPARVQRKDAEILKNEFNCNMVRCSHYPQSPAFLDACDELGLLVWEEAPGWHNVSVTPALAGPRGAERPRHGDQGPEPSLGGHLGHQAQRDPGLPRAVGRDQAGRAGARPLAAEFRRDGVPRGRHLERGRLRLQRLRDRPEDRQHRAQAAVRRPALPGHRGGRRGSGQAAALRLDGPAGLAGQAGRPARPGAEPGAVRPRLLRPAGLGRVRLRLAARPGPGRHQVGRGGGRLPGPQARRRHLPDAGRPGRAPGHHPGVLLGGRRRGPRRRPRPR